MELSHQIIQNNDNLKAELISFVTLYGISGLQEAMRLYIETSQNYICKTKTSVRKIKIRDIYYLQIHGHKITIHTANDIYHKYGTLHEEFAVLSAYGPKYAEHPQSVQELLPWQLASAYVEEQESSRVIAHVRLNEPAL